MKRLFSWVIILLCLCSCGDKANTFVLEGTVGSLTHDTIYIYGADALYEHIDTVVVHDGMFRYSVAVDTVVPMWVVFPGGHREMVFADKGLTATIQGDTAATGRLSIVGSEQNALLHRFQERVVGCSDREMLAIADSFIRANPYSEVSIYLLRENFVLRPNPDITKIKALIGSMSGNLQDNNYIKQLQHSLNAYKPLTKNNAVNSYSICDSEGKIVSTIDYKNTYLLITFWASWDEESRQRQRELVTLKEKYKNHNFDILSVSLDTNREAWLQAIDEDSATWRQACDFDGWSTGLVQRMHITNLPSNVLINPSRRVQGTDLYGEKLDKRVGELTTEREPEKKGKKTPTTIRKIKGSN